MENETSIAGLSYLFACDILRLNRALVDRKKFELSKQLLRCGTSIGANVEEASVAQSKRDFITKMSIASKEARETRYWLKLLKSENIGTLDYTPYLVKIEQIVKVLTRIVKTAQENERNAIRAGVK